MRTHVPYSADLTPLGFTWQRIAVTLVVGTLIGLLNYLPSYSPVWLVVGRVWLVSLLGLSLFVVFERWPRREPRWMPRWLLQLIGIICMAPVGALIAYFVTTGFSFDFFHHEMRRNGFAILTFTGVLFAPWVALGALVHQREVIARQQALQFELERSQLEHQALDARMRLLQAQVQPHFLFNTLANVKALVDAGSPQASNVLTTLIAYLRAAVPRLDDAISTLRQEEALVRAYLELMHLRMPDRLQYSLDIAPEALDLHCPPLTLLTLVENAVRHGIDPSEDGGRIDVWVRLQGERVQVRVSDTGIGLSDQQRSLGTGLATLRERLDLSFDGDAHLRLSSQQPHGALAELDFPARSAIA